MKTTNTSRTLFRGVAVLIGLLALTTYAFVGTQSDIQAVIILCGISTVGTLLICQKIWVAAGK